MIEVKNLVKTFGEKSVVKNTTWTAKDGKITGFIGPNGAGKTTSLSMVTGSLKPTSGEIRLNGIDIAKKPLEAKRCFGYVSDSPDNFLRMKGIEYLNFIADVYDTPEEGRAEFIETHAERFGILDALNQQIVSYSHGMRQKVMVMGALIHKPSIWILDEPLTGLDPQSAFELKNMMKEHVAAGNSVLFSTHVLEVAEKLCDEVIIIKAGEIKFDGTLEKLRSKYKNQSLEKIFLTLTTRDKTKTSSKGE